MAITYSLAPNPKWYIADMVGRPLGAGSMYTYSSLDNTVEKAIYQDAAGTLPWSNPVLFDENGSQGPFYWETDSDTPTDLYYVEVYDIDGVRQWTINNFDGTDGGGGGGTTTILDINNLVPNNILWRGVPSASPIAATSFKVAPGIHTGLAATAADYGPDIFFKKSNTNCTDSITFPAFGVGSNALTTDLTPQNYINYTCTAIGAAGETYKYIQIPISKNVQSIQNTSIAITIWARANSGASTLRVYLTQFFGDGASASTTVRTLRNTITLTTSWVQTTILTTIPAISGKTVGFCGNDGLFLQLEYPLNLATNIDFIKPCIYLGSTAPTTQFSSIESIESLINSHRTGHVVAGYDLAAPYGYLLMDDLTIGAATSVATSNAIAGGWLGRSLNTFPLYNLLWNSVSEPSSNTLCVVSGGGVVGASAAADFEANRTITLQAALGRALASAGGGSGLTFRTLGSIIGSESHTLLEAELASHSHDFAFSDDPTVAISAAVASDNTTGGHPPLGSGPEAGKAVVVAPTGSGTPFSIMQPTTFLNYFIKL